MYVLSVSVCFHGSSICRYRCTELHSLVANACHHEILLIHVITFTNIMDMSIHTNTSNDCLQWNWPTMARDQEGFPTSLNWHVFKEEIHANPALSLKQWSIASKIHFAYSHMAVSSAAALPADGIAEYSHQTGMRGRCSITVTGVKDISYR
jgi:hypothetical protein